MVLLVQLQQMTLQRLCLILPWLTYMIETLLDIKQNLIIENMLPTVVIVTLVFTQSENIMLKFYDYSLVFCRWYNIIWGLPIIK